MHHVPGTIVVGVDGSESADRALKWAARQADAQKLPLTLLHAVHSITRSYAETSIVDLPETRQTLRAQGHRVLDAARETVAWTAPDIEVHEIFELADPRDVLLQLSHDAAMVVVGSRGLGTVRSLLLGSVSVAVVRHAHCPVVVLRPEHDVDARLGVAVGVDTLPESQPVLDFAYREAALLDLPLTLVYCLHDLLPGAVGALLEPDDINDVETERVAVAEVVAGMSEHYPEVHVTTRLARGLPQEVLSKVSDSMDLVVVGAHQPGRVIQTLFGSVSVALVEHADCPVAVVPLTHLPTHA